ncbi:MAG: hypothetical protein WC872_03950, partial [Candidatus Absconditabacterales bacterium]
MNKKLFSGLVTLLIIASQTPLGSLMGTVPTTNATISGVTVISPNTSVTWNGSHDITWTTIGEGPVDIMYCIGTNCGFSSRYVMIAADETNDGTYSRNTTTAVSGDSSQYKIRVMEAGNRLVGDNSDSYFTLDNTAPSISFTQAVDEGPAFSDTITPNRDDATVMKWMYDTDRTCSTNSGDYTYTNSNSMNQTDETNNTKYICMYAEDSVGNYTGSASVNPIYIDSTVPSISITNNILQGPTGSDSFVATGTDAHLNAFKYGYVDNAGDCTTSVNTAGFTTYTGTTVNITNETYNNKYVCFYAADSVGNKNIAVSDYAVNIDITDPSLSITDNIVAGPTSTESFAATLTETNGSILEYGYVDTTGDCNTGIIHNDFTTYTSESTVDITDETHNNKYVCFFAQDQVDRKAVAISTNKVNLDITNPTVPSDTLTSPNGGTYRTGGSVHDITWNSGSISDTNLATNPITLSYSTNGGIDWTTIASSEANDGTYSWTTPDINSTFLVKITAVDNASNTSSDTSDATFIIDNIAPTVSSISTSPNPGSGTVNVTVYFTEALAGIYISQPPTVSLIDGEDTYVVTPSGTAGHTNGYVDATPTTWQGSINVSARTNGTLHFKVTGARDRALNTMADNTDAGTVVIDTVGPTLTINNGTAAGPVQTDIINITLNDDNGVTAGAYGFSNTSTGCASATYSNSFSSASDFSITGDHNYSGLFLNDLNGYLCIRATDSLGNISYTGGFLLNTDNTAPHMVPVALPSSSTQRSGGTQLITWPDYDEINIYDRNLGSNPVSLFYSTNGGSTWTTIITGLSNDKSYSRDVPTSINTSGALVKLIATDIATNYDYVISSGFIIDNTAPVVTLTNHSFSDDSYTNDTTPTFTGHVTDNLTNIVSVEYSMDGVNWTGVGVTAIDESFNSTSENYTVTTIALAFGNQDISIRAIDNVGNITSDGIPGYGFIVDTTTPTIDNLNVTVNSSSSISVAGLTSSTGLADISEAEYYIDSIGTSGSLSLGEGTTGKNFYGTIDISGLSNTTHTIYVRSKNLAGTRSLYTSQSFTKVAASDTTSPTLTFSPTSLNAQYTQSAISAVTFTATPNENVTLYINGTSEGSVTSGS